MHEAEKLCDFILLINKGKVVLDDRLAQIRAQQSSHAVCVELEGDTSFVKELAVVAAVKSEGNRLEITLAESADSQELLRSLMARTSVRAFEVKVPSLHEIFVNLVGKSDAEDS
jgi:ABC-2 type transport system ATP-binding protein